MPSSPHLSPKVVVLLISLVLTVASTWVTLKLPETPEDPLGWFGTFLRQMVGGLWNGGRKRYYWAGILAYSVMVSVMHFGGLYYDVYIAIEHWDYLTHVISGGGVATLLYLTFHLEGPDRRLRWILPAVLAVGAGFEVYEFVFKNFWYDWTLRYYVLDTIIDLANNTLGSLVAVGLLGAVERWSGQRSK